MGERRRSRLREHDSTSPPDGRQAAEKNPPDLKDWTCWPVEDAGRVPKRRAEFQSGPPPRDERYPRKYSLIHAFIRFFCVTGSLPGSSDRPSGVNGVNERRNEATVRECGYRWQMVTEEGSSFESVFVKPPWHRGHPCRWNGKS